MTPEWWVVTLHDDAERHGTNGLRQWAGGCSGEHDALSKLIPKSMWSQYSPNLSPDFKYSSMST